MTFHALYIVGVLVFAVLPGLADGSLVVAVDLAWGTVLTASVAAAGFGFGRWLGLG